MTSDQSLRLQLGCGVRLRRIDAAVLDQRLLVCPCLRLDHREVPVHTHAQQVAAVRGQAHTRVDEASVELVRHAGLNWSTHSVVGCKVDMC